jgi:gas vesicle protein
MRWFGNFLLGLSSGLLIGGLLGLLFAPAKGDETLQKLRDEAQRLRDEVQSAAEKKRAELETELAKLRHPAQEV